MREGLRAARGVLVGVTLSLLVWGALFAFWALCYSLS
jgi:hypothetical protein